MNRALIISGGDIDLKFLKEKTRKRFNTVIANELHKSKNIVSYIKLKIY